MAGVRGAATIPAAMPGWSESLTTFRRPYKTQNHYHNHTAVPLGAQVPHYGTHSTSTETMIQSSPDSPLPPDGAYSPDEPDGGGDRKSSQTPDNSTSGSPSSPTSASF